MHCQLLPKKIGKAVLAVLAVYIHSNKRRFKTNRTERISFKSGCVVWVAKYLKEDWFKVLG